MRLESTQEGAPNVRFSLDEAALPNLGAGDVAVDIVAQTGELSAGNSEERFLTDKLGGKSRRLAGCGLGVGVTAGLLGDRGPRAQDLDAEVHSLRPIGSPAARIPAGGRVQKIIGLLDGFA